MAPIKANMEDEIESDFDKKRKRNASGESTFSNDSLTNYIPTPPDGGWGWVIVFASFMNHVIVDGITFTFGVFYMAFVKEFGASQAKTALVGSLLAGFYLMTGPIASALVNRFGCRPVCISGAIVSSAAFVFATLSTTIDVLMLTYGVLAGFGFGLIYLPSVISVSYYFEKKRALATGIAVCGAGVGGFVFAPAGRILMTTFSWKNSLYIVSGICLMAAFNGALMRPLESPRKKKPRQKNFLDRIREQTSTRTRTNSTASGKFYGVKDEDDMFKMVQEAKEARERQLQDDDGDSEFGSQRLRRDSEPPSRKNSIVKNMNRRSSEKTPNADGQQPLLNGEQKVDIVVSGPESSPRKKSAIPLHMQKEIDAQQQKATSAKGLSTLAPNGMLVPPATNGHAKPQGNGHQLSVSHACGMEGLTGPQTHYRPPKGASKEDYARPLYRRDIFYSGSILHIPNFRSQPDFKNYVASITTIPCEQSAEKEGRIWRCLPIPKVAKDVLKEMLDVSLLKDPVFLIACLGEIFGFIGLFIPFVYVTERAISFGINGTQASLLLSVIGVTNTLGRIAAGFLADFPQVNALLLHNIMMIMGGVACCLNQLATTYWSMVLFCGFFGLCVATYISLTSIILCNLMGLEKLTSAFGFLTLVRGLASIAGPPVAGMVYDATQSYDMSFHVGGIMFILAGSFYCLLHLPMFSERVNAHRQPVPEPPADSSCDLAMTPDVTVDLPTAEDRLLAGGDCEEIDITTPQNGAHLNGGSRANMA